MALFLHIGFPKTATTSLQLAFQAQNDALLDAGICYPLPGKDFKQRFLKFADMKGRPDTPSMQADFDSGFAAMTSVIQAAGAQDVVLSCEELTNFMMMEFSRENLRALRDRLREIDTDIRLIAYVRNPSDFYLSILQERLKRNGGVFAPDTFKTRFSTIIGVYEEVFETQAIVREFHPKKLKDGDIVADFLQATGLERLDISGWEPISSNESISPEALAVLDLARRTLDEGGAEVAYAFPESELLWRRLRKLCAELGLARKPILFKAAHDAVMAANAEECEKMADRYGITFADGKYVDDAPDLPAEYRISDFEGLMTVNRAQVFHLWSVLQLDVIRDVLKQRGVIQKLRADARARDAAEE